MNIIQNLLFFPFRILKYFYLYLRVGLQKKGTYILDIPRKFSNYKKSTVVELLSGNTDSPLYFEFLKELELIRDSPTIEIVAMFVDTIEYGFSEIHEIGRMLEEIKGSGKTIKAHSITGDIKTIYLLSYANERYSIEGGEYMFFLPAVESIFWGKFLKSWGVEVEAFTSGKYKSFAEPFQREKFSPEARANLSNLIVSIKNQIIEKLNKNTGLDWLKSSKPIMSAAYLKNLGFINGYIEETDFKKYHNLKNIITDDMLNLKEANVLNLKKLKRKSKLLGFKFFPAPKELIMIIPLKGNINMGNKSEEDLKEGNIHAYPVIELLRSLTERDEIKIIIFEIDSGGGSAFASELIYREIKKLKNNKKIYAYFQNISASGGYYIGCAADEIISSPYCITGSIGTVLIRPNLKGLYDKLQLSKDRIEFYPGREIFSEYGKLSNYSKNFLNEEIERVKNQFYNVVCLSRKKEIKDLEPLAGGRVFTGKDFLVNSMVDSNEGFWESIERITKEQKLKNHKIEYYIPIYNFKSFLKSMSFIGSMIKNPLSLLNQNKDKSPFDYKFPYTEIIPESIINK